MNTINEPDYVRELVEVIRSNESDENIGRQLDNYHENDIAAAIELLDIDERKKLYKILGEDRTAEVFSYLDDVGRYIDELAPENAVKIIENMDSDDAADVLKEIDEDTRKKLMSLMDDESRRDIRLIYSFDEDEIGSLMTTNFILIKRDVTIKQAMKELIAQAEDNDNISTIYAMDEKGVFYGAIDLKDLIIAREYVDIDTLISKSYPYVR